MIRPSRRARHYPRPPAPLAASRDDDLLGRCLEFAGVPLAFAFLATLGRLGIVTILFKAVRLRHLSRQVRYGELQRPRMTYLYFQIPLMILIIAPAIDGLRKEWSEAAADAWRDAIPVLALCRAAGAVAKPARHPVAAVRQRFRRHRHRLCAGGVGRQHRPHPAVLPDPRRRPAQSRARRRAGSRHDRHHGASPTSSIWWSAPAPNGGSNEAVPALVLAGFRPRRRLLPAATGRDLHLLAAHAAERRDRRCLYLRIRGSPLPGDLRLLADDRRLSPSSSASSSSCRPPTSCACACRSCARSSSSSRSCR